MDAPTIEPAKGRQFRVKLSTRIFRGDGAQQLLLHLVQAAELPEQDG
jgi:hypothetical protein